jgi:amino acid transporter
MSSGTNGGSPGLKRVRMSLFTAVIVAFTLTCGGSFGLEDAVGSSGPGFTLLLMVLLPIFWAAPMALVSAELGSMLPEEGGFYRWVRRALGEFWGFQAGWWWQLCLFVDTAVYIALTLDYMQGWFAITGWQRWLIGVALIAIFTVINIRGLDVTGWVLTVLMVIVIVPFVVLIVLGFARATTNPLSPFLPPDTTFFGAIGLGLPVLMWMFSGYESMSQIAGEIENPQRIIPKALLIDLVVVVVFYFLTTAAGVAAIGDWSAWSTSGEKGSIDFVEAGRAVGGGLVAGMLIASLIAGNLGLFTGYLASGSRPAYVLSKDKLFARWWGIEHKKYGTPWVAILFMAVLDSLFIIGSFSFLIIIDVFLLMFAYVLILVAGVVLRVKAPHLKRGYRIPLPTWGLALFIVPPIGIAVLALATNGWAYFVGGCVAVLSGPLAYLGFKSRRHGVILPPAEQVNLDAAGALSIPTLEEA